MMIEFIDDDKYEIERNKIITWRIKGILYHDCIRRGFGFDWVYRNKPLHEWGRTVLVITDELEQLQDENLEWESLYKILRNNTLKEPALVHRKRNIIRDFFVTKGYGEEYDVKKNPKSQVEILDGIHRLENPKENQEEDLKSLLMIAPHVLESKKIRALLATRLEEHLALFEYNFDKIQETQPADTWVQTVLTAIKHIQTLSKEEPNAADLIQAAKWISGSQTNIRDAAFEEVRERGEGDTMLEYVEISAKRMNEKLKDTIFDKAFHQCTQHMKRILEQAGIDEQKVQQACRGVEQYVRAGTALSEIRERTKKISVNPDDWKNTRLEFLGIKNSGVLTNVMMLKGRNISYDLSNILHQELSAIEEKAKKILISLSGGFNRVLAGTINISSPFFIDDIIKEGDKQYQMWRIQRGG